MRTLYNTLKSKMHSIDFSTLYKGFYQMPFALYNDTHVYLNDREIPKTEQFYGNTSIQFEGDNLAIWYLSDIEGINTDALVSKIVHEMFHAYQAKRKEIRFPNEIVGVRYPYHAHNLSIKQKEHELIHALMHTFTHDNFSKLCTLKAYRKTQYTDAYLYESAIETIEGMAVYVELMALKQLNTDMFKKELERLSMSLVDPLKLVPIRAINYISGALMLVMADKTRIDFMHTIGEEKNHVSSLICQAVPFKDIIIPPIDKTIEHLVDVYKETIKVNIETKLKTHNTHLTGVFEIIGLDPMNTMYIDNTLYCKHFLAYKDKHHVHYLKQASVARVNDQMEVLELFY